MLRKRLAASVAAAPLLLLAHAAWADTTITTGATTPIVTSSAGNVTINSGGSIKPTVSGPAIKVDNNSSVTINSGGEISSSAVDNSGAVLVNAPGASAGDIVNVGAIKMDDNYTATDSNGDGNLDGVLAKGTGRYGIKVSSGGVFTGSLRNSTGGSIIVDGANAVGISVESPVVGTYDVDSTHDTNIAVLNQGVITVTGDNVFGIHVAAAAPGVSQVTGEVRVQGSGAVVQAIGLNATGVAVDGKVDGKVLIQGTVESSGYSAAADPNVGFSLISRPATADLRAKLGADDMLQGGSAVRVTADVTHGVLIDIPPTASTSTTLDGDGDGIIDNVDTDQDNDGVTDTAEGTGLLATYGKAPALLIGSDTSNVTIGNVGVAATSQYGLISLGTIFANGLYDGVSATGVQIGGQTGKVTDLTGGARFAGSVLVKSYEANATGIDFKAGAVAPNLTLSGTTTLVASSDAGVAASLNSNGNNSATGVLIESGASVTSIALSGAMSVQGGGGNMDVVGIRDLGGHVTSIEITSKLVTSITPTVTGQTIHGAQTAIDVSHASGNVSIVQKGPAAHITTDTTDADGDGVYDLDEPAIVGDIKFGAGNDTLDIRSGNVIGAASFGAGADKLILSNASNLIGAVTDSDGALDISLSGTATTGSILTITNPDTINATSLTTSGASTVTFTANPNAGSAHTDLVVGTANLGANTHVGLRFTSLLVTDQSYTVIDAAHMTAGTVALDASGNSPFLYHVSVSQVGSVTGGAGSVVVDARRRTAAELGLNKEGAAAYNAVYGALFNDSTIRDVFLAQTSQSGFMNAFNQMLPNQGAGIFSSLMLAGQSATDGIAARPDPHQRYGPDSFWIQEINTRIQRGTGDSEGSDTKAFGFVSGYESMGDGGALGLTMAYVSAEERGSSAQVGEQTSASLFEGGAYWRGYSGNLTYAVRGGVGYVHIDDVRKFVYADSTSTLVNKTSSAKWNGYTVSAGADVAYEARMGRFYARPSAGVDYLYFSEGGYTESGGGTGFDLTVSGRNSSRLDAEAMLAIGAEFGRDSWWRPEVRVGYRQRLAGSLGNTVARFSGGSAFSTSASNDRSGAFVAGFSLKAGTPMSYLALEGDSEISSEELKYLIRLVGRVMF